MSKDSNAQTYQLDIGLSKAQFQSLGEISANWSLLDYLLTLAIADIIWTSKKEARVLSIHMNFIPKVQTLRHLAELRQMPAHDLNQLNGLLDNITEARSRRRLVIHGVWAKDDDGKFHILRYWGGKDEKKRILGDPVPMGEEELQNIAEEISGLTYVFARWWNTHKGFFLSSRGKQKQPPQSDP